MNAANEPQEAPGSDFVVDPAGSPRGEQPAGIGDDLRSIPELVSGVVENVQNIVRSEVQLAKAEFREEAQTAARAASMLAAGTILGIYALGLLLMTIVWLLATQMSNWLAALIVTVVVAAVAATLVMLGRSRLEEVDLKPERTVESLKEDVEWVKQQTR